MGRGCSQLLDRPMRVWDFLAVSMSGFGKGALPKAHVNLPKLPTKRRMGFWLASKAQNQAMI